MRSAACNFWGAQAAGLLAMAARHRELFRKIVSAGRRNPQAGRLRSPDRSEAHAP